MTRWKIHKLRVEKFYNGSFQVAIKKQLPFECVKNWERNFSTKKEIEDCLFELEFGNRIGDKSYG